jgi:hypothetical protein
MRPISVPTPTTSSPSRFAGSIIVSFIAFVLSPMKCHGLRKRMSRSSGSGNWKTTTFITALRHDCVTAPFVLEGAVNGETFKTYVEQNSHSDAEAR